MPRSTAKKSTKRSGATLVEFAVVAGPMFLMIFALIEFTRVCMMSGLAEDACYAACRHVIVPGATVQEGIDRGNEILAVLGASGTTITVTPRNMANGVQTEIDEDTASVTVDLTLPMAQNLLFLGHFTGGVSLQKTCTMTTERYTGFFDGTAAGGGGGP